MENLPVKYDSSRYYLEKARGDRLPNGLLPLKRLTGRHIAVLVEHLAGRRGYEIATKHHIREVTVSRIINDPLGQAWLQRQYQGVDREFEALYGHAVGALRDGLKPANSMKDRLRAAELHFKKRGDFKEGREVKETAEDVIQRILNLNVQVNVTK